MPKAPPTLKNRRDFLACARAHRWVAPGLILQGRARRSGEAEGLRVGYTCSKKVGNAVARNRAKRRLRAAAAEVLSEKGRTDWDYVLIGKSGKTAVRPFPSLLDDLKLALDKIHRPRKSSI
ncbi:MAG: ribonuclease P protein component [Paracoccaceae bacterium]